MINSECLFQKYKESMISLFNNSQKKAGCITILGFPVFSEFVSVFQWLYKEEPKG